ncbi:MAG TPA: hypothetical protein VIY54_04075 [Steroidobacteraceae bacterium]
MKVKDRWQNTAIDWDEAAVQPAAAAPPDRLCKSLMARQLRSHIARELYDDSGAITDGTAIYTLSDPRDLRAVRYVGQTSAPRRRFLQHLNTARLWLPQERPWWVKSPRLRPLYDWIRELYRDDRRLPTMVVCDWVRTAAEARRAERNRIVACLACQLPLLNIEAEILGRQIPLL